MSSFFDRALEVTEAKLVSRITSFQPITWEDFFLNPRRLRGSDFLMRWSQGRWSEDLLIKAVFQSGRYVAVPYGPSSTAPKDDVRGFEMYFEKLEKANPAAHKRPDLLVLPTQSFKEIEDSLRKIGGSPPNYPNLPFIAEEELEFLLHRALLAVECENSLWICKQMPDFNAKPRPMKRLGGKFGLPRSSVLPTIIVKEEDRAKLRSWQTAHGLPIHVWHVFFDLGFGVAFEDIEQLIASGELEPTKQQFQAPSGQSQAKVIYKMHYFRGYELCKSVEAPSLKADSVTDKNGHILPFVRYEGGKLELLPSVLAVLKDLAKRKSEGRRE